MVIRLYMMKVSPPCRAVLMTIRHIGIEAEVYEENIVMRDTQKLSHFRKINPRSCVPTIDDDGFYLWESRAIMTYLVNKYAPCDPLYPRDPKKRAVVDMMLSYDQGTLYKSQVEYLYPQVFQGETPQLEKETTYQWALTILEDALEINNYCAGTHVTLADLSILANITLAEVYGYDFFRFPNISKWLNRLKMELPYYYDVNEQPLLQFRLCYTPRYGSDEEEGHRIGNTTKL